MKAAVIDAPGESARYGDFAELVAACSSASQTSSIDPLPTGGSGGFTWLTNEAQNRESASTILRKLYVTEDAHTGLNSKAAERLTAPYVYESCKSYYHGTDSWYACTYSTNGMATGPYPGTFTANGTFGGGKDGRLVYWFLSELFTIASGTSTTSGRVDAKGIGSDGPPIPGIFRYKILHRHGKENAKIDALQNNDFSETLRRL